MVKSFLSFPRRRESRGYGSPTKAFGPAQSEGLFRISPVKSFRFHRRMTGVFAGMTILNYIIITKLTNNTENIGLKMRNCLLLVG